jgi:hypothetical protein
MESTEFSITDIGTLRITLTAQGNLHLERLLTQHPDWDDVEIFIELIDHQLNHGWYRFQSSAIYRMKFEDSCHLMVRKLRKPPRPLYSNSSMFVLHFALLSSLAFPGQIGLIRLPAAPLPCPLLAG